MKKIEINGISYDIDCNALTYIDYRKKFNKGIFQDIDILQKFTTTQVLLSNKYKKENPTLTDAQIEILLSKDMLQNLDEYIEASTRLAYSLIYTADDKIGSYEDWLKNIKQIKTNDKWIVEVTEFAVDNFC